MNISISIYPIINVGDRHSLPAEEWQHQYIVTSIGFFAESTLKVIYVCESWAKGPWKGFPLRKPLGMQLTVSAKVFFWNGESKFFSGESFGESLCTYV